MEFKFDCVISIKLLRKRVGNKKIYQLCFNIKYQDLPFEYSIRSMRVEHNSTDKTVYYSHCL